MPFSPFRALHPPTRGVQRGWGRILRQGPPQGRDARVPVGRVWMGRVGEGGAVDSGSRCFCVCHGYSSFFLGKPACVCANTRLPCECTCASLCVGGWQTPNKLSLSRRLSLAARWQLWVRVGPSRSVRLRAQVCAECARVCLRAWVGRQLPRTCVWLCAHVSCVCVFVCECLDVSRCQLTPQMPPR